MWGIIDESGKKERFFLNEGMEGFVRRVVDASVKGGNATHLKACAEDMADVIHSSADPPAAGSRVSQWLSALTWAWRE